MSVCVCVCHPPYAFNIHIITLRLNNRSQLVISGATRCTFTECLCVNYCCLHHNLTTVFLIIIGIKVEHILLLMPYKIFIISCIRDLLSLDLHSKTINQVE